MIDTEINFETAKLAKEKGFDIGLCFSYYKPNGEKLKLNEYSREFVKFCVKRCNQSLLQKWLREIHNIEVFVRPFINVENNDKHYRCFIVWFDGRMYQDNKYFNKESYEQSLEIGLQEALKLI